jgi:F420 biosynthesis protein FbiB-like protein
MSAKDVLRQRRSIRKYTNQPVSDKIILEILETASWAPSAHNAQPWRFIVVSDIGIKQCLAKAMAEAWIKDQTADGVMVNQGGVDFSVSRFSNAPVFIVACLSLEDIQQYLVDDERWLVERDLMVQSLGAAVQNLLLSACGNGLGACWFSAPMFCKNVVRQVLGVPETVEPQAIILMGYPDEKPTVRQRKPVETFCFRDCWGKPF